MKQLVPYYSLYKFHNVTYRNIVTISHSVNAKTSINPYLHTYIYKINTYSCLFYTVGKYERQRHLISPNRSCPVTNDISFFQLGLALIFRGILFLLFGRMKWETAHRISLCTGDTAIRSLKTANYISFPAAGTSCSVRTELFQFCVAESRLQRRRVNTTSCPTASPTKIFLCTAAVSMWVSHGIDASQLRDKLTPYRNCCSAFTISSTNRHNYLILRETAHTWLSVRPFHCDTFHHINWQYFICLN